MKLQNMFSVILWKGLFFDYFIEGGNVTNKNNKLNHRPESSTKVKKK